MNRPMLVVCACLVLAACSTPPREASNTDTKADSQRAKNPFNDVSSLIPNNSSDWPDGTFSLPEIMGPGVGWLDLDGDGSLEIVQLKMPRPGGTSRAGFHVLDWDGERYVDSTASSGVALDFFAQAIAAGDVDADGDLDLYLANYGADALLINEGELGFSTGRLASSMRENNWGSSATFCDYDADGDLDLFVVNYLDFDPTVSCLDPSGAREYCDPARFEGVPDRLYHNDGRGSFEDVTLAAGITPRQGGRTAKGLGVVCTDLTGDGYLDFYVANDDEANHLWVNDGRGGFSEQASMRGAAVNRDGHPEASMGLAVGDVDGDGATDLFMTHLSGQNNTLYRAVSGKQTQFDDVTSRARMAVDDLPYTGFGCAFLDFDNDGDLDLAVANGRVFRSEQAKGGFWERYAEPDLLFENDGKGQFERLADLSTTDEISRGMAYGDYDGDGDLDLLVSNVDNTLRLYRNDTTSTGRSVHVVGKTGSTPASGATLELLRAKGSQVRVVTSGTSYMSAVPYSVHFGASNDNPVEGIVVRWPDGTVETFRAEADSAPLVVEQGRGSTP